MTVCQLSFLLYAPNVYNGPELMWDLRVNIVLRLLLPSTVLGLLRAHVQDATFRKHAAAYAHEVVVVSPAVLAFFFEPPRQLEVACGVEEGAEARRALPDRQEDHAGEQHRRLLPHPVKEVATCANGPPKHAAHVIEMLA